MFDKVIEKWPDRILSYEEADSTNEQMKIKVKEGVKSGTVLLADYQTRGKGRLERIFESPSKHGIYFTYFVHLPKLSVLLGELTPRIAVEMVEVIRKITGVTCDIKWVNDLKINGKKVVGILTEILPDENEDWFNVIVGIGVNVNTPKEAFSESLQKIASSLSLETGSFYERDEIILKMIEHLDALFLHPEKNRESAFRFYEEHCITLHKKVTVDTGGTIEEGECISLNPDYSLMIRLNSGEMRRVFAGEVSVKDSLERHRVL